MKDGKNTWVAKIAAMQDQKTYAELNWDGSLEDYLEIVRKNPKVTRTAFQRVYDMILSHGKTEYIDNKKKLIRYHFFSDERFGGKDAIFGLDSTDVPEYALEFAHIRGAETQQVSIPRAPVRLAVPKPEKHGPLEQEALCVRRGREAV